MLEEVWGVQGRISEVQAWPFRTCGEKDDGFENFEIIKIFEIKK